MVAFVIAIILIITFSQIITKNISNKNSSEEYFAYLGSPQKIGSLNIVNEKSATFYVASGTYNEKTATFFVNAQEIDRAIKSGEKIIAGNKLVVELLPEWIKGAQYKLRFRQNSAPIIIFSGCQGKSEECYLEAMRNLVRKRLEEGDQLAVSVVHITVSKEDFEIIEATPKKKPRGRGCHPTYYEIIKYSGDLYTFRTIDICID